MADVKWSNNIEFAVSGTFLITDYVMGLSGVSNKKWTGLTLLNFINSNLAIDASKIVSGLLPFARGGIGDGSYSNDGVLFYNGTLVTTSSRFIYDGNALRVSAASNSPSIDIVRGGLGNIANFGLWTGLIQDWSIGIYAGTSDLIISNVLLGLALQIDKSDNRVNIPTITASTLVATDASSYLIPASGTYNISISGTAAGAPPTGAAGGSLIGSTYPNPVVGTNQIGNSQFRPSINTSVVGRPTNDVGNVTDISATADDQVLRRLAGVLAWGSMDLSKSAAVGSSILGQNNGGSGTDNSAYVNTALLFQDSGSNRYASTGNLTYTGAGLSVLNDITTSGNVFLSGGSKTIQVASLTASKLVVTDGSKNLISGGAIPFGINAIVTISSSTQSLSLQTLYVNTYAGGVMTGTLPSATGTGKTIQLIAASTASTSGWVINAGGSDKIQFNGTLGAAAGSITSTVGSATDCVTLIDAASNLWIVYPAGGLNLTVA